MTLHSDPPYLPLGDMIVMGDPPGKLMKALAVIARDLHPTLQALPNMTPDITKESCVLCSLTVRDFLQRIGIDAFVAPVVTVLWADENGKQLHSAGIGVPGTPSRPRRWNGHMVVIAPRENFLIDTTLYQINRAAWADLPGMMALPVGANEGPMKKLWGLDVISAVYADYPGRRYEFSMAWLANPTNNAWKNGPDARRDRRRLAVNKLARTFGAWRD